MMDREEAIRRGTALIEANGGRVVPSLGGLVNERNEWITALRDCSLEAGQWWLVFDNLDPPDKVSSPGGCIVLVGAVGGRTDFLHTL